MTAPTPMRAHDPTARWQELRRQFAHLPAAEFRSRHPALTEEVLGELLLRWQEARARGRVDEPERLCELCPELTDELRQRIAAVRAMEARLHMAPTLDASSATDPAAGADARGRPQVPGFEILEELGRGGMGVVYKAQQLRPSRVVALKMMLSGRYARPSDRARFEAEAEALAELQHPNIVQIHQIGEDANGLPYFAMEYVAGGSLAHKLRGWPVAQRDAAQLVETLARAVQAAHQRGIIHRDLKPANVLFTLPTDEGLPAGGRRSWGVPKITDFGLAKRLHRENGLTPSHAVMGTFRYMAPEQAEGKVKEVGTPADVYALGGILYELLTGQFPVQAASDLEALSRLLHEPPTPPRRLNAAVDRNLETICLKCLHKDPGQRYSSAAALADDLRRFLSGEPIQARRAGWLERTGQWVRRRPALAALAFTSAVAVLALVGAAVSLFYSGEVADANARLNQALGETQKQKARVEQEKARVEEQKLRVEQEKARTERQKARADHSLYLARVRQAHRAWQDGNLPLARELLAGQVPPSGQPDFRDFEWDYLDALAGRTGHVLGEHPGGANAVAVSPDGKRLASAGADGKVLVWDGESPGKPRVLVTTRRPPAALCLAFSVGGRRLAVGRADGTVAVWDPDSDKKPLILREHADRVYSVAYSPNGDRLVTADDGGEVRIWDVSEAGIPVLKVLHNAPFCGIAFLPRSDRFLLAGGDLSVSRTVTKVPNVMGGGLVVRGRTTGDGIVRLYDALAGEERELEPAVRGPRLLHGVAASPDGKRLATAGHDHTVRVWELGTTRPPLVLKGHTAEVLAVTFSPDGKTLASGSYDRTVRIWDARGGQELHVFRGHTDAVRSVAFRKDGRLVSAADDGTVRSWDAERDREALVRAAGKGGVRALACSPDGLLAWGGDSGEVRLWAEGGAPTPPRRVANGALEGVAFSRDGDRLAVASGNGTVSVWEVRRREGMLGRDPLRCFPGNGRPVVGLAFSADGKLALAYGQRETVGSNKVAPPGAGGGEPPEPGEVIIHDPGTGSSPRRLAAHAAAVHGLVFSPDGKRLATAGAGWEGETKRPQGEIKVWEVQTGKELLTLKGHVGPVLSVAWSPDGKTLASGGYDYTVRLWSAEGKLLHTLPGHVCLVHSVAFYPDGTRLASGSEDWVVKVWDVRLGAEALDLRGHTDRVQAVAFGPDGQRLYSGGADGTLRVWEAPRRR